MKTRPKTIDEMYADINKLKDKTHDRFLRLKKELSEDIEETKNAVDERAQFVEDLLEGLGRQQHPGTVRCLQCFGAGGKWQGEKRSLSGPHGILHYLNADNKHWWSCDACKGTGRIPIEEKKG